MSLLPGLKIESLTPRQSEIDKLFKGHLSGVSTIQPEGWFLPTSLKKFAKELKEFEFEENDVIVMTMPKAGTTWTQEAVWTMRKNPDLDNQASIAPLHVRSPILEADILAEGLDHKGRFASLSNQQSNEPSTFFQIARASERPRIFKTHLSFCFLSDTALSKAKAEFMKLSKFLGVDLNEEQIDKVGRDIPNHEYHSS
ncbi:sulfotransferase 1C4-like [Hyalella azteca]|uniref:Sulfotransferase 1C4-like n=1 Tax=Hyalella azteca TaxID=294128 RepID=A0A8B7P3V6_HYAAZ|nr:sulfotransferase 1C4-like [Hyalella azteca]